MNNIKKRISALSHLANFLGDEMNEEIQMLIQEVYIRNPWFTPAFISHGLGAIRDQLMDAAALLQWVEKYPEPTSSKSIGLILAGNIPAVGWHDVLCSFLIGHKTKIKYSEKDNVLIPFLISKLTAFEPQYVDHFITVDRLKDFDAVIATGSNNTAKYFEQYFGHKPHIIRKNRNGIAVLDGSESTEDFVALGKDIFTYFGLGCRNVSKMYVPRYYDFHPFLEALHDNYKELAHHNKYKNNIDYNIALYLLNKVKYQNNGCLIILEDPRFISRIASLHYEYYDDKTELINQLTESKEKIQCIVSKEKLIGVDTFLFGQAQYPALDDYADGVDTMAFLANL